MQKSAEFCIISLHIMKQLINHIFLKSGFMDLFDLLNNMKFILQVYCRFVYVD